jgi:hypothetical protein
MHRSGATEPAQLMILTQKDRKPTSMRDDAQATTHTSHLARRELPIRPCVHTTALLLRLL